MKRNSNADTRSQEKIKLYSPCVCQVYLHLFSLLYMRLRLCSRLRCKQAGPGGVYLGQVLLGMCRCPLRTPTPL